MELLISDLPIELQYSCHHRFSEFNHDFLLKKALLARAFFGRER